MFQEKLAMIAADPKLIGKVCDLIGSMPNVDFPTMGGKVFWDTLAEAEGWRLQKNKFTDHCRIIDPNDVRRAWGSEKAMTNALNKLQGNNKSNNGYRGETSNERLVFCPECGAKVPNGKFCKECGSRMD